MLPEETSHERRSRFEHDVRAVMSERYGLDWIGSDRETTKSIGGGRADVAE